jgi:hypothetical protein
MEDKKENDVLLNIIDFVDISITPEEYNAVVAMYNSICDKNIDSSNIISHVILLMKIVSSFQIIEKIDKKKLVIFIVQKFIHLNVTNKEEILFLNSFVENILPNVIDTLCSVDSKKIIINAEQYLETCCFPSFGKKK